MIFPNIFFIFIEFKTVVIVWACSPISLEHEGPTNCVNRLCIEPFNRLVVPTSIITSPLSNHRYQVLSHVLVQFISSTFWRTFLTHFLGTDYIMDHEVVSCQRAFSHGHASMVQFFKAFGPFTRCKPNVDQEKWPCTQKWMCWIFYYMSKKDDFENFLLVWPSPLLLPFVNRNYHVNIWTKWRKKKKTNSLPWSADIIAREPLSPTSKPVGPWQWVM